MDLSQYRSISEIPDRELLEAIYATNMLIYRELTRGEEKQTPLEQIAENFVEKTDSFHKHIEDHLVRS